jgi:hypothetical protein
MSSQEMNANSSESSDEQTEEEKDTTLKQQPFSLGNGENVFAPICYSVSYITSLTCWKFDIFLQTFQMPHFMKIHSVSVSAPPSLSWLN